LQGLSVLSVLAKARQNNPPGLTLGQLRAQLVVSPDDLDSILHALMQAGLVAHVLGVHGKERLALICDPDAISAAKAAEALWFDGNMLPGWKTHLPQASALLGEFYADRLENLPLSAWLTQEKKGQAFTQYEPKAVASAE
jgi:hypothetical protein